MNLKRKKTEETKAKKFTKPTANIRNKLGLAQTEPDSRVKAELLRLKGKSNATWKAIGLDRDDTLRRWGIG